MGWFAVIACYWTSATLLAHLSERNLKLWFWTRKDKSSVVTNLKYNFSKESVDNYGSVHGDTVFAMLTEEQQKVLKDLQKEQAVTQKTEANKNRVYPYDEGGAGRSLIFKGECRLCGVQGHWQKDKMCKAVDIQRKAVRDASMQYQQQWVASVSYSGQPMQQYSYGAPALLAPAAAGYAGLSSMGGSGQ